jgi:hypothetical protein
MLQRLQKVIHTKFGQALVSIILGLGLASIFRKACNELNCLNFVAPKTSYVEKTLYKYGNNCYRFKAKSEPCNTQIKSIRFA